MDGRAGKFSVGVWKIDCHYFCCLESTNHTPWGFNSTAVSEETTRSRSVHATCWPRTERSQRSEILEYAAKKCRVIPTRNPYELGGTDVGCYPPTIHLALGCESDDIEEVLLTPVSPSFRNEGAGGDARPRNIVSNHIEELLGK